MSPKFMEKVKKAKAADTPRKAEKVYRPPGSTMKKLGRWAFWMLISFIALSFLMSFIFREEVKTATESAVPENLATSQQAVEFAKSFAQTYFTWKPTAAGWEQQITALSPMLGEGVAETAGIMQSGQTWSSEAGDIRLVEIKESGDNKALITLEVLQKLSRQKEITEAGQEPETERKEVLHYFTVPVAYDVAYGVYELPSFTAVTEENAVVKEELDGEPVAAEVETSINNFLPTFFQSYAADPPDKLAYVLQTGEEVAGLEGTVEFVEVTDVAVVAGKEPETFEVVAYVVMMEPATGTKFTTVYHMAVKAQDGRYVVTKLNQGAE